MTKTIVLVQGARLNSKAYEDRSHYTCAEPGWEEAADFALAWPRGTSGAPTAPH